MKKLNKHRNFIKIILPAILGLLSIGAMGQKTGNLPAAQQQKISYKMDEIIVKFKPQNSSTMQSSVINSLGATKLDTLNSEGWSHVKLAPGDDVENAIKRFKNDPNVEYAQPNFTYQSLAIPNDTNFGQLWGLRNSGQTISNPVYSTNNPGSPGKDINMERVWDHITDCSSTTVAVIDSGINYNQEDLTTNLWNEVVGTCKSDAGLAISCPNHGWDYVDNDNDPFDTNGHGTHVAGTIGAVGNNGLGSTGICWSAKIMAVRVLDITGSGTTANIVKGINFAIKNGAKVINMSLGGESYDAAFSNAIFTAQTNDVVVIAAAGNNGTDNNLNSVYPCNFGGVLNLLCVAALDQSYARASFSNYGSIYVDIGAPGTNIFSTAYGLNTTINDDLATGWSINGWIKNGPGCFGLPVDSLNIPIDYCNYGYPNDGTFDAIKTYDLSSFDKVVVSFYPDIWLTISSDSFQFAYNGSGAGPFTGGTFPINITGPRHYGFYIENSFEMLNCNTASCSIGFRYYNSLASPNTYFDGASIALLSITGKNLNNTSYELMNGTSMATPHVAGLAALIRAQNPNYTYADTISSLKNGGVAIPSLSGVTVTGKAIDGWGSLTYISKPTGLGAAIQ